MNEAEAKAKEVRCVLFTAFYNGTQMTRLSAEAGIQRIDADLFIKNNTYFNFCFVSH